MPFFYIYETVDFPIKITPASALEDYKHIVVSMGQKGKTLINKKDAELGIDTQEGIINMHLSQEETGKFKVGEADLQVNILYNNTERDTSAMVMLDVRENLLKQVMENE